MAHVRASAPASAPISISATDRLLHVYNVHLGTAVLERRYQAPRLASYVHDHRITGPKIILGDFNEWMRGLATRTLSSLFESIDIRSHLQRRRTYPGIFPVLHLDHIYYEGDVEVQRVELPRTRKALMASDHLPLVANLRIGFKDLTADHAPGRSRSVLTDVISK